MASRRTAHTELSIEDLDRELIARGAQIPPEELFKFKGIEGTPARDAVMARIKELYDSVSSSSPNPALASIDTWELSRLLNHKTRQFEENRKRGIWYSDYRMDFYGITDEQVKKNAECVAAIMLKDNLVDENNGYTTIKVKNYGEVFNLCEAEPYRDQPISAGWLCTGFLVEKDIIATAGHCVHESTVKDLCIVFGFKMLDPYKPVTQVSNENIYKGVKITRRVYNLKGYGPDWALVQLDREVLGQEVATLYGKEISVYQPVYVIGHPVGLPLKYAPGAHVCGFKKSFFAADLDLYMGNSGSPVFNGETHEVIGIVVRDDTIDFRWTGKGWLSIVYPNRLSSGSQCSRISDVVDVEDRQIFISYSHSDKKFVNRLTTDLENFGIKVWIDEKEIDVGDSISKKVEEGIFGSDYFCLVISRNSVNSEWVDREYRTALNAQLSSGTTPKILPLLIQGVELPKLLKDIKYADFSRRYKSGLTRLLDALGK